MWVPPRGSAVEPRMSHFAEASIQPSSVCYGKGLYCHLSFFHGNGPYLAPSSGAAEARTPSRGFQAVSAPYVVAMTLIDVTAPGPFGWTPTANSSTMVSAVVGGAVSVK
jgi:hypothetical protein